ncbi:hypothetical protein AGABI2DRAFT_117594 [Agaricus bisporus var. bisporus H97]|uniref:hypothetical protein n=1 Tax=Agaricus bisporus var. bisporus (strain H97 / ATCC MYA-4626 / FGSC 10389) TaxID=936046 RepID=UPI00029F7E11|nr:hypothetical protein AGABI2DRAFT_117594 [Agaricus bisporus var. bisporus H97]EKV47009.1 hypothetical protein AGABI2DRAFT_117594 [Agaricus bisporus var. bisporus H97]
MHVSLPFPLFPLLCVSILLATILLAISAIVVAVSLALWIIPVAFIVTLALHAVFVFLSNTEKESTPSLRLFSAKIVFAYFCATTLWTATLAVLLLYTAKLSLGKLPSAPNGREWAMISASALSLLQTAALLTMAVHSYKIRQQLRYKAKWQWKPSVTSSQWRRVHIVHHSQLINPITIYPGNIFLVPL